MSFQALAWAMRQKTGDMASKAVLMALANYADDEGSCFPSVQKLADDCECSARTVIRALKRLGDGEAEKSIVGLGIVSRSRRSNARGGRASDRYFLLLSDNLSPDNLSNPKCQIVRASKDEPITEPIKVIKCARARPVHDALLEVLDEQHTDAIIEHRKRQSKALTAYAARLLARKLAAWPDPNEAADEMIANGWIGFNADWMKTEKGPKQNKKHRGDERPKPGNMRPLDHIIVSSRDEAELFKECERIRGCPVPFGPSGSWSFPRTVVEQATSQLARVSGAA